MHPVRIKAQDPPSRNSGRKRPEDAGRMPAFHDHLVPIETQPDARANLESGNDRGEKRLAVDLVGANIFGGGENGWQDHGTSMKTGLVGIVDFIALYHCAVEQDSMHRRCPVAAPPDRRTALCRVKFVECANQNSCPRNVGGKKTTAKAIQDDRFGPSDNLGGDVLEAQFSGKLRHPSRVCHSYVPLAQFSVVAQRDLRYPKFSANAVPSGSA